MASRTRSDSSQERPDEPATVAASRPATLRLPGIKLTVVQGPDRGREIKAPSGVVRVGTSHQNDLVLTDEGVSRRHLEIRMRQNEVRVVDLQSTNGTTVDGVHVVEAILSPASLIRLGSTAVRVTPIDEPLMIALSTSDRFGALLGVSAGMREVFGVLERVAPTDATVVLEGETGTGKEVAAEAIHHASPRSDGPFVAVDCGAIPSNLIESELFGHVRGAFTGAISDRAGVFEQADGGTLFLDEIGELPLELQPKLLRALEMQEIRRVGESVARKVDVRVVAATNRHLAAEVNRGGFREDLYFRLAVVEIRLPPLRGRPEDIPILVRHFLGAFAPSRVGEAQELAATLIGRPFPGNARELRNAVQRLLAMGSGTPGRPTPSTSAPFGLVDVRPLLDMPYKDGAQQLVEAFEKTYLERALERSGGSVSGAARSACLSRRYVQKLLTRHGLRGQSDDD